MTLNVPVQLLRALPEGRFAACPNEDDYTFFRVADSKNKDSIYFGTRKIQKMHGDSWDLLQRIWPNGKTTNYGGRDYTESMLLVCLDWRTAACLFADKLERCARCGIALQDPESRRNRIGPECIKHWPEFVAWNELN